MLCLESATVLRLGVFLGVFAAMAIWEALAPRRALTTRKSARWARNLGLVVLGSICVKLLVPLQGVGVAALADRSGWGLLRSPGSPRSRRSLRPFCFSISRSTSSIVTPTTTPLSGACIWCTTSISTST